MEHINRINEIQSRAKKLGIRIDDLCLEVKIAPSTFYRWQDEAKANPRLRTLNRVLKDMLAFIEATERENYERLHEKYGEAS